VEIQVDFHGIFVGKHRRKRENVVFIKVTKSTPHLFQEMSQKIQSMIKIVDSKSNVSYNIYKLCSKVYPYMVLLEN
jgi:hypothetical protein